MDALKDYTLYGSVNGDVNIDCNRCGVQITTGHHAPLVAFVKAAIAHSGVCLG